MRDRFDFDLLDPDDPFEIDDQNRPHLYKHVEGDEGRWIAVGVDEIFDLWGSAATEFLEAKENGAADWLMIGMVPGMILVVPLAPSRDGQVTHCRPIGIYSPSRDLRDTYLKGRR